MQSFTSFLLDYWQLILIIIFVTLSFLLVYTAFRARRLQVRQRKPNYSRIKSKKSREGIAQNTPQQITKNKRKSIDTSVILDDGVTQKQSIMKDTRVYSNQITSFSEGDVREKIIYFLSKTEPKGAGFKQIKKYCDACFDADDFNRKFQKAFDFLKDSYAVSYEKKEKRWIFNPKNYQTVILRDLTDKEERYFKYKKLGTGWFRLGDKNYALHAIWWIYQNLNPDEFEQLCCALLSHHQVTNIGISPKRESGADGGIDGFGEYLLDGETVKIAVQVKKFRPNRQVQTDEADKFVGALTKHNVYCGFFITTGIFSERTIKETYSLTHDERNNIRIELLDQNKIIEALLYRADSTHGYGLHKTDDLGLYYINPDMLRRSISKG